MRNSFIKTIAFLFFSFLFLSGGTVALAQSEYRFRVRHDHLRKYCEGELVLSETGVEYVTANTEHARKWAYVDIKMLKLVSPTKFQVLTYEGSRRQLGRDREFKFELVEGEISREVSDFLLPRVKKPVLNTFVATDQQPLYLIPVRHRQGFGGGGTGALKVYPDGLVYESENDKENSRYWRWSDIQGIARSGQFRFSVTTFEPQFGGPTRSFNFDLKEAMDDRVYDYLWDRVFKVRYYPPAPSTRQ